MADVEVFYEATPNPQSLKFVVTQSIADQSVQISRESANRSPLASKLFGFPWASEIFIGPQFVTVTKEDWVEWDVLADPLSNLIKEHIESGEPILVEATEPQAEEEDPNDPEIVRNIKKDLNAEVRPAVAMDGGDIVFSKYEDQILYLHMRGACSGCPSSMITLKQGIEARMQELFPEIKEVVAI